jgi:hypothetical protein
MNKKIIAFFLLIYLIYKKFKNCVKFLHKILVIFYGLFYLLEYLFIFSINNYYIYIFLICKYDVKENYFFKKKLSNIYTINENVKKKIEKKKTYNYIDHIFKIYYYRHMYFGFTVVYTQIFLRKIKEFKNYVIYMHLYKLKRIYNNFRKKIIDYSLLFFLYKNYKLVFFLEKLKIKIFIFIVFFNFYEIYTSIKMYLLN